MSKVHKLNSRKAETLQEQYPNEGKTEEVKKAEIQENNHFRDHSVEEIRKKYLQFTVYMEALNAVLELPIDATLGQFSTRIHDLVMATNKEQ